MRTGEHEIGRSTDADVVLSDALASRHHARLTVADEAVTIEDLGSRHGVYVNDVRIGEPRELAHGDRVRLGRTTLVVITPLERSSEIGLAPDEDSVPSLAAAEVTSAGGAGPAAIREALGAGEGAARTEEELDAAARHAIVLAVHTGEPAWLERVYEAHAARGFVLHGATIDMLRHRGGGLLVQSAAALERYVSILRVSEEALSVPERVRLRRLEGLLRAAGG